MNNYFNYQNPYIQKMYNQSLNYQSMPKKENTLFEPYEGYIRGNMFPNLYDKYKEAEPYEVRPLNGQAKMLTYIDSLQFALKDLNLYLDIYPDDRNIIDLYNEYRKKLNQSIDEYENTYGPLLLNSNSLESYPWAWDDKPWPWEGEK